MLTLRLALGFATFLACSTDTPTPADTGTSQAGDTDTAGDTAHDTAADSGADSGDTGKDTGTDTGKDTGNDTSTDTGNDTGVDSGTDTGGDTSVDTGECSSSNACVAYACFCGTCTDADIQCVTQAWADANPCALGCPVSDCPELALAVCTCDSTTGSCVKE